VKFSSIVALAVFKFFSRYKYLLFLQDVLFLMNWRCLDIFGILALKGTRKIFTKLYSLGGVKYLDPVSTVGIQQSIVN